MVVDDICDAAGTHADQRRRLLIYDVMMVACEGVMDLPWRVRARPCVACWRVRAHVAPRRRHGAAVRGAQALCMPVRLPAQGVARSHTRTHSPLPSPPTTQDRYKLIEKEVTRPRDEERGFYLQHKVPK
jgi:hypothetical protein